MEEGYGVEGLGLFVGLLASNPSSGFFFWVWVCCGRGGRR